MDCVKVRAVINKGNGQINISLPKKKIDKDVFERIKKTKCINLKFDGDMFD